MRTTNLVVKIASRCNLNCTYCYMYNMGDDSYKLQPKFMSKDIVEAMLLKIKNHCLENKLERFLIIFHGGEPLLIGKNFYVDFVESVKKIIPKNIKIDYSMQSNGILLDNEWCKLLKSLNIQIGISLDGTPSSNNLNRVYHNGKGSYDEIINGFNIVKSIYGKTYSNCLCVIDTNEVPLDVYKHFKNLDVHSVSFLFQDFNYLNATKESVPKIGDWLIELFNSWYEDKSDSKPVIKPFDELIGLILGQNKGSEVFGKGINDTLVIETDGSIETVDTLRICGNGFTKTNYNVLKDELGSIFEGDQLAKLYYNAHNELSSVCKKCPIESICGGGYLGHRYSQENKFDNPSIYCNEIVKIICHIQNKILENIPKNIVKKTKIEPLNYFEIINQITTNV
ncbi:radical SAM protein [Flavobacterium sp. RSP29]|uniref:radical SAM protein n=1 Tax=Flavobacterium sp. RSP29 TaxID=3401731 RepID=UPI003AAAB9C6